MTPAPGERLLRFVGDRVHFAVRHDGGQGLPPGWTARLRTNLGRARVLRREILEAHTRGLPVAGASWRDLPMKETGDHWSLELPLAEVGWFRAKPYLLDPRGWQHWPEGSDVGISVHPNAYRSANIIYCAFPRLFGASRTAISARNPRLENQIEQIEEHGFSIIPPSGKLRDVIAHLPHVMDVLGCRILHLLPVSPTPTTYARFGRFGSPYAALDLTAIDPALIAFDKRTTGVDQFRELTYATHLRGGRVFLDIVINHTGWGSNLQENSPQWFLRNSDGTFASPGAWGVTWEDLVELKHENVALWDSLAEMFLTWCRRGVDGFRCDAGYKVPVAAWQYIITRVQQEYPETLFLLEGLGGAWEATEALLTEGGMQWAYSELFQNHSPIQVSGYLDHSLRQSERVGVLVHYSETHDNERLAAHSGQSPKSKAQGPTDDGVSPQSTVSETNALWSLMRNRLCGLASVSGGYGFTCGVEWLAREKIDVHRRTGLSWGQRENIVAELLQLNRLLAAHPCFFDGAHITRLSSADSAVLALVRVSAEGKDAVLVLINTDAESARTLRLPAEATVARWLPNWRDEVPANVASGGWNFDLLGQALPPMKRDSDTGFSIQLPPGAACCLSPAAQPVGLSGESYRRARAQAAWGIQQMSRFFSVQLGQYDWRALAEIVERAPADFLAAIRGLDSATVETHVCASIEAALKQTPYPNVIRWSLVDRRRVTPVPPDHWLLIEDNARFRATLTDEAGELPQNVESIPVRNGHVACFPPRETGADAAIRLERYAEQDQHVEAAIRFLAPEPALPQTYSAPAPTDLILLTNGRGGMARMCVDPGHVQSKYDCVLGANLHPALPVDRHVFAKRLRVWVNADGFLSPLDSRNLVSVEPGPPAIWRFVANAGDGQTVEIEMRAEMPPDRNATVFDFCRPPAALAAGKQLPDDADVRLTVRVDIEDRNFHWETRRNGGADAHFATHVHPVKRGSRSEEVPSGKFEIRNPKSEMERSLPTSSRGGNWSGFSFTPGKERQLRVTSNRGEYHPEPEWSENIPHPVEQSRGQTGSGDAYSPGWFEIPLPKGGEARLIVTAEMDDDGGTGVPRVRFENRADETPAPQNGWEAFGAQLARAARAFVVRRGSGKTVIAGYPWFLDWGRDTLICARGLIAAGMTEDVQAILLTFARFEEKGTLPNSIFGDNATNRDTSDAPLWFALACEELAESIGNEFYHAPVNAAARTIRDVLVSIAENYCRGTMNGIRMGRDSGLIWSPAHFTWMDTNYPAGTAREGYPIELQALWIRLLRRVAALAEGDRRAEWNGLADRVQGSIEKFFWLEDRGWYADVLFAGKDQSAANATASDALRSNCLFPVSLGLVTGDRARRCVAAAAQYLVVPGALRTLAPLPVSVPLPVHGNSGQLLNNPTEPYQGRYEGDEDTRRKVAYHNGTAWTWTFPNFCEALARAWGDAPETFSAARAYLGSMDRITTAGCLGQIPEILDGDAPHTQRGCDAQAWGVTEALRVWKWLGAQGARMPSSA